MGSAMNNKKIGVVIPAYNEQELISKTICSVPAYVDCIIVVDDFSTDRTVEVIESSNKSNLYLIKHKQNCGVGGTIISGYKEALSLGCQVIAVMGADAQMHPDDLETVLMPVIKGYINYSKGNRFIYPGISSKMPKLRIFGNFCFSILSCIASGYYHIFDTQCGFTAIDNLTLQKMDLDTLYPRYGFPTDILAKLNMISAKVIDVPVRAIYGSEKSGIKTLSYTMTIIGLSLKLFLERQMKKLKREITLVEDL